jgi:hypothetical protein
MSDALERRRTFAEGLSKEERVLVLIRDELYEGSWEDLERDLQARREGKPAIFKLITRIDEDLSRIQRLRAFERDEGVNLRPLIDEATRAEEGRTL